MSERLLIEDFKHMKFNPFPKEGKSKYLKSIYSQFDRRMIFKDPNGWQEGVPFDEIPESIKSFYDGWKMEHCDLLLRFIIVFSDSESPLFDYGDFDQRKKVALLTCKYFAKNRETYTRMALEITRDTDYYHLMLTEYFKMRNTLQYENWFSMKMNMHHITEYARKKPSGTNIAQEMSQRQKIQENLSDMNYKLIELEYSLFKDESLGRILAEKATEDSNTGFVEMKAKVGPWQQSINKETDDYELN